MKRTLLVIVLVLMCVLAMGLPALADSQARIVRLSYVTGAVQIDRNAGQGFEKAIMNVPITQGTQLRTESGQAEVEFENGSTVRLTPETAVVFDSLTLANDGTKVSQISLQKGVAYFNLDHKDHNEFSVLVSGRDLGIKKSAHFRVDAGRGQTRLAVIHGEVQFPGPSKKLSVHKNQTLTSDPNEPSQYAMAKGIDEYQYDAWDSQRERYQVQYTAANYGRGVPYYGWDDLNYYGSFGYYPGYGYLWRPFGVGYGWDPFATGYWMWYPSFGYTWVSPYAWGWTPYRYGSWVFVPGYGWNWRPGGWNGWHSVPPVQGAPPVYRNPIPPAAAGGTVVIGHPHPPANPGVRALFPGEDVRAARVGIMPTPNIGGQPNPPGTVVRTMPSAPPKGGHFGAAPPPPRVYTGPSGSSGFGGARHAGEGASHIGGASTGGASTGSASTGSGSAGHAGGSGSGSAGHAGGSGGSHSSGSASRNPH